LATSARGLYERSAAPQLARLGFAAIPELIGALEDARPTRVVTHSRAMVPTGPGSSSLEETGTALLRVGDCALAVLERIAGRKFYEPSSASSTMFSGGQAAKTRKLVEEWWAGVKSGGAGAPDRGEKQLLIDSVAAGKEG